MTAPAATPSVPAQPLRYCDGVPVYGYGQAPDGLLTTAQLEAKRLKPADGQQPLAYLWLRKHEMLVALFDPTTAARMRPLGQAAKESMRKRRTCPTCGKVGEHIVRGKRCHVCLDKVQAERLRLQARTCWRCGTQRKTPYSKGSRRLCRSCAALRAREERERHEKGIRRAIFCTGRDRWQCRRRFATRAEVEQWCSEEPHRGPWGFPTQTCASCQEKNRQAQAEAQAEYEERQRRAAEHRREQVAALEAWAADVLADDSTAILDTETTGLHDEARIVEISAISGTGRVLLNTLVNPGEPIPDDAQEVHGIGDGDVRDAPNFSAILADLTAALEGRRVIIYNAPYDVARLRHELDRHHGEDGHPETQAWLARMRFEDAMVPYSEWVGEEHEYYGGYRWQPLCGGHRALGDCRAVIDVLTAMSRGKAARYASTYDPAGPGADPWSQPTEGASPVVAESQG